MQTVKVRKVGNSLGMVLPKEAVARMNVREGDTIYLTEAPDGGFRLTPVNEEFAEQIGLADDIMREDRNILRELAKR
ncbi:MAG: AbrB/MazE/SpoVT family DNA-binding domain-containing protein [Desulfovibrio sp.]|jgi:putative addiction module antidote|uniref:AbrB/MazE/SpoVT family DNA-binding domain-containing protein n=1 Tax=Nitratidesulfovibrio sp. SRB-5 TaxID=2872636 RepID=UPI001025C549|nr:AbrB/MazE/SpoVT family DNA-binding domain-containing protein [Nitratidesulfovibrio sp. SRB-5]MBZ2171337.1 AbrB/MazE/SpoVT family DNA-binding domain-containing protein [Nitratidesulfovibrio sp. SRB-5]MDR3042680.1 AbrB/MazE/SpoVT family DNA-binding domain-containing protein [Desulfovibrio sp.]RXF76862.1 AbrB/MazE/SpoVT family DNA-binding domain-containing protein [Desulfovibrio sp. DS-1]HEU6436625.1 AbrB/MazE/SpoVT family DNA-binding domain-containing protein [Nitratidesulfovibrio sp.]